MFRPLRPWQSGAPEVLSMRCVWLSSWVLGVAVSACGASNNGGGDPDAAAATDLGSADVTILGGSDAARDAGADVRDAARDAPSADLGPSSAGAACTSDTQCNGLTCDTDSFGGYCTNDCTDDPSQTAEARQCGGTGSTCLTYDENPSTAQPFCARACDPEARTESAGACRAGYYCTGFWFWRESGEPDSPGCVAFCDSDSQCPGSRCNPRTGYCSDDGVVTTRRADGEPCDPSHLNDADESTDCRGFCIQSSDVRAHGICSSEINLRTTSACPDNPTAIQPLAYYDTNDARLDNSGVCAWRTCATSNDCTAPLRCIDPGDGSAPYCDWPETGTEVTGTRDAGAPRD